MNTQVRVYLAGKIAKNDWRHDLFPDLRGAFGVGCSDKIGSTLDQRHEVRRGRFVYAGPFFVSCDHGCRHGDNSHGQGAEEFDGSEKAGRHGRGRASHHCRDWICDSDVMFVWLDDASAYGTVAEIGFAVALGVEVWTFVPQGYFPGYSDLWFPLSLSDGVQESESVFEAWKWFSQNCPKGLNRYRETYSRRVECGRAMGQVDEAAREAALSKNGTRPGFIYVLLAENGLYKIGRATNLDNRIEKIGIQVPMEIRLVHATRVNDAPKTEALIHAKYRAQRVKGEWFELSESDLNWIRLCPGW